MARNKHPEQTVDNILNVAARLFMEKGFEKTSIQDILNELDVSKGAIYHHFASKDDILLEVIRRNEESALRFLTDQVKEAKGKTGRERLEQLLHALADSTLGEADSRFTKLQYKNPVFLINGMVRNVMRDAEIIRDLIDQGNADGSMSAEEPEMIAEILLILFNVWSNPLVFSRDYAATKKRLHYLQNMIRQLGVDVFSDTLIEKYMCIYERAGLFENESGN